MSKKIFLVDRGRGLQLSTSRITVQDLVPYFQEGCSHGEIMRWIPTLSEAEFAVVETYYREHQVELDDEDRHIRNLCAQRKNSPEVEHVLAEARPLRLALIDQLRHKQANGEAK